MNALLDVTTRACDTCKHTIDFDSTAAAERFLTSSKWVVTLKGFRCPVCAEAILKGGPTQIVQPRVRRSAPIYDSMDLNPS